MIDMIVHVSITKAIECILVILSYSIVSSQSGTVHEELVVTQFILLKSTKAPIQSAQRRYACSLY